MTQPPRGSAPRAQPAKPTAPGGPGVPPGAGPPPDAAAGYRGFQVALAVWAVAFAVLVLYELVLLVVKLAF